jgi:hypothetical protein
LDEFTFRFNRRKSKSRGKLFYRLAQQAVLGGPVPFCNLGQTTTCCTWWRQVNTPNTELEKEKDSKIVG